jgi:hypothetical protein
MATITEAPKRTTSSSNDEEAGSLRVVWVEIVPGMATVYATTF